MAKLYFRYACMSAGKSAEILQIHFNYSQCNGMEGVLFIPKKDTRSKGRIKSRLGISAPAIQFEEQDNLFEIIKEKNSRKKLTYIIIDEASFLKKEQVDQLGDVVDYLDIDVLCYGLVSDFKTELFEGSKRLMEIADEKLEISVKAMCWCGEKAVLHARVVNDLFCEEGKSIVIDDRKNKVEYFSLCRKHHKERKWKPGKGA